MPPYEVALECPKCKKQGLVRLEHSQEDIFECVYCHYKDDLSKPLQKSPKSIPGLILTAVVAVLVTLIMIGV